MAALFRINHQTPVVLGQALPADVERVEFFEGGDGIARVRVVWHHKDDESGQGYANGDRQATLAGAGMEQKLADAICEFVTNFIAGEEGWDDAGFVAPMRVRTPKAAKATPPARKR